MRTLYRWLVDIHNAICLKKVNAVQRKQPHRGYYDTYHGYWLTTLSIKQNIEKCKAEKRANANRKNTNAR